MKQKTQMQYLIADLIDRAKTDDMISLKLAKRSGGCKVKKKKQIEDAFDAGSGYDGDWELEDGLL